MQELLLVLRVIRHLQAEKAAQRQHYVLGQLAATGLASEQEVEEAGRRPENLWWKPTHVGVAPYFTDAVRREVLRLYGFGLLNDGLPFTRR